MGYTIIIHLSSDKDWFEVLQQIEKDLEKNYLHPNLLKMAAFNFTPQWIMHSLVHTVNSIYSNWNANSQSFAGQKLNLRWLLIQGNL